MNFYTRMPPNQSFYKVRGVLIQEKDRAEDSFSMFVKAIDDNHAVILVRDYLKNNAPEGRSVIKGIEKITE